MKGRKRMFFKGSTVAGDPAQPNEDWVAITSDLVVLLDGATARTETGCQHGAAWYTRKLGAHIIASAASKTHPLELVLADAIREVAALHPECDLQHPGTPSAAVAIVRVTDDLLRYVVLGDVTIVLDAADSVTTVSDQRVSHTARAERAEADKHSIGTPEKDAALVAMKHEELAARNREPGGYWIAAADPSVVEHAIMGEVTLADVKRLAVVSDGAARFVDLFGLRSWSRALDLISQTGPQYLINRVRSTENVDPQGTAYRRNKRSDDATIVYAEVTLDGVWGGSPDRGAISRAQSLKPAHSITEWMNSTGAGRGLIGADGNVTRGNC